MWQERYLGLMSQRDLPNLGLPSKPMMTERLLKMIAAVHGQEWNASKIGASLGINYQTVNSYLGYLHGNVCQSLLSEFPLNSPDGECGAPTHPPKVSNPKKMESPERQELSRPRADRSVSTVPSIRGRHQMKKPRYLIYAA
jgi:hypothetical protein